MSAPGLHGVIEAEAAFAQEMKTRALKAERERDELREAARAMVEAAADMAPHCSRCHARVAVTKRCPGPRGGAWFSCDEHATADAMDLNHAPALRRLRELSEGEGK